MRHMRSPHFVLFTITVVLFTITVLASTASNASGRDRFDLICNVQETESFHAKEVHRYLEHISLDLISGRFCIRRPDCKRLHAIAHATSREIVLFDDAGSFMQMRTVVRLRDLRIDSFARIKQFAASSGEVHGKCRIHAFTPFPASAHLE